MTISADHHELAGAIQRLIRQEQYTEAQELLPSFAQAVVEACNTEDQEQEFLRAKQFLQSAVIAVKGAPGPLSGPIGRSGAPSRLVGDGQSEALPGLHRLIG